MGTEVERMGEFKEGDRVAAFHPMMTPHGAFAEYAVSPSETVFKLPRGMGFEGTSILRLLF
jgi:NADPH:quinone reductase-like Zn-dependent oxidoreductase